MATPQEIADLYARIDRDWRLPNSFFGTLVFRAKLTLRIRELRLEMHDILICDGPLDLYGLRSLELARLERKQEALWRRSRRTRKEPPKLPEETRQRLRVHRPLP